MTIVTTYFSHAILNHALRGVAYTAPDDHYLALFTSAIDIAGAGTEVIGGGYVRKIVTFDEPANRECVTDAQVTFATATGTWGLITHAAVMDAETSGNMLFGGELEDPILIQSGDTLVIPAGNLRFKFI